MSRELYEPVDLCDYRGRLRDEAIGWSRRPLHRAAIEGRWGRRKRWHHWYVVDARGVLALTVADLDYLSLAVIGWLDRESGRWTERFCVRPFGIGSMPDDAGGSFEHATGRLRIAMGDRLEADAPGISARIAIERDRETLDIVVPWDRDRFQYNSKQFGMPARGEVVIDRERIAIDGWSCLDFGRGVWPYRTAWNWACACDASIAFNLGARWTDGTGITENGVIAGGRLARIASDLRFDVRSSTWSIEGEGVSLRFHPASQRRVRLPLGIASWDLRLGFGTFEGRVLDHSVRDVFGWAEELQARW